jgi:hypothetical protein
MTRPDQRVAFGNGSVPSLHQGMYPCGPAVPGTLLPQLDALTMLAACRTSQHMAAQI